MESLDLGGKASSEARAPQGEMVGTDSVTESESDDLFYDNDNVSVISDSLSISSKTLRKYDTKKLALSLHRLKQENMALRDSLAKMNATDVVILKAKLRAANADLVRIKQVNTELRDLNQILEKRLASVLAELSQNREKDVTVRLSRAFAQQRQLQHLPPSEGGHIEAKTPDAGSSSESRRRMEEEMQLLQRRLKHAERLLQSYEVKLSLLQVSRLLHSPLFFCLPFAHCFSAANFPPIRPFALHLLVSKPSYSRHRWLCMIRSQGGDNGAAREPGAALNEGETADTALHPSSAAATEPTTSTTNGSSSGSSSSVSFASLPQPRKRKVYSEDDLRRRLEESREVDKRTIQELLQEIKRLEAESLARPPPSPSPPSSSHPSVPSPKMEEPVVAKPASTAAPPSWPANLVVILPAALAVLWVLLQTAYRLYRYWFPSAS